VSELAHPLWNTDLEPTLVASRRRETHELVFPAVPDSSPLANRHETVSISAVHLLGA
jgi:hypothetical protein